MADDNLYLRSELELDVRNAERKVNQLEKKLDTMLRQKERSIQLTGKVSPLLQNNIDSLRKSLAEAKNEASRATRELNSLGTDGARSLSAADSAAGGLVRTLGAVFSLKMAKDFAGKVMSIRGEFQQLEIAFETMLGNKDKADKMMSDSVELAAKTPFDLQGVAAGAKSLLAYGMESGKVIESLRRLGDVAAGLSLPLGRLTAIYGQTMVKGKLQTRDLIRYQAAGIPILDELAKMYKEMGNTAGDSANKVRALVTAGKVGFADVEKVFTRMTSEGGKFANLMEKQSASITGRISNIQDAIDEMFNEIGQKSEGVIYKGLDVVAKLVENYEKVGKVLAGVAATYGVAKAASMAYLAVTKASLIANEGYSVSLAKKAAMTRLATVEQKALNAAIKASPYVLAAAAIAAVGVAIYKTATHTSAATKAMESLKTAEADVTAEAAKEIASLRSIENRLKSAEKGTKAWNDAKNDAIKQFGKYNSNISSEITSVGSLKNIYDDLAGSIYNAARMRMYQSAVASRTAEIDAEAAGNINKLKERMDFVTNINGKKGNGSYNASDEYMKSEFGFDVVGKSAEEVQKELDGIWTNTINHIYDKNVELTEVSKAFWNNWKGTSARSLFGRFDNLIADAREDIQALGDLDAIISKAYGVTDEIKKKYGTPNTTPTETPEDRTDKELQRQYSLRRREAESIKKINRERLQMEIDVQQRELNLKADGYDKERAQNELNFKKEMLSIKNQREDKLKELQEEEKAIWQAANPDEKEYNFKPTTITLPEEYAEMYDQMEDNALDKWVNANVEANRKLTKEFGDHKAKMLSLEVEWDEKIDGASGEALKRRYEMQKRLELAQEEESYQNNSNGSRNDRRAALEERLNAELAITNAAYEKEYEAADEAGKALIEQKKQLAKAFADFKLAEFDYNEISEYGDFEEVLQALKDRWKAQIATLPEDLQEGAQFSMQAAVDAFVQQFAESGRDLELQEFYNILADKSVNALKRQLERAQKELEALEAGGDSDALEKAKRQIAALQAKISALQKTSKKNNLNLADMASIINDAAGKFQELGDIVGDDEAGLGDMLKTLGALVGIAGTVVAAIAAITAAEATAATVTMGWLAIVGAAIAAVAAVVKIVKANEEADKRAAEASRKYALALEELNDAARLENLENVFGSNGYGIFKMSQQIADEARKAAAEYEEASLDITNKFRSALGLAEQDTVTLVADMRSGWQQFWGSNKNIERASLADFYDNEGNLNVDRLKEWNEQYGEYLSDSQKTLVDNLITEWERYETAMESVNDYLSSLFNDTAANIADAMINSFEQSGDALADLTDIANSFGKSMAKSMITSVLMDDVFTDEAQEKIKQMLLNDDAAGAVETYNQLLADANAKAPELTEFLKSINLDWNPDERSGETKGIAQASQDSVDELNGRATVIQSHTFQMNETTKAIQQQNAILVACTADILSEVRGIHDDTGVLRGQMATVVAQQQRINSNVEWIIDKGVRAN